MKDIESRTLLDAICKYIVLFAFTAYMGMYIYACIKLGKELNLPDWIVMKFTIVFMYFFRRSPEKKKDE